jgi:hypothetical protein
LISGSAWRSSARAGGPSLISSASVGASEPVRGQLDSGHAADLEPAELDQVTRDDLAGIGELGVDRVARAAAAQDHQRHREQRDRDRGQDGQAW